MKLLSWNTNGLRALMRNGALPQIADGTDFVCLQETKSDAPIDTVMVGYGSEWTFSERLGYAGVASLYKQKPLVVTKGLDNPKLDTEGCVLISCI